MVGSFLVTVSGLRRPLGTDKRDRIGSEQNAGNVTLPRRTRLHLRAVRKNQSELTPLPDNIDIDDCAIAYATPWPYGAGSNRRVICLRVISCIDLRKSHKHRNARAGVGEGRLPEPTAILLSWPAGGLALAPARAGWLEPVCVR